MVWLLGIREAQTLTLMLAWPLYPVTSSDSSTALLPVCLLCLPGPGPPSVSKRLLFCYFSFFSLFLISFSYSQCLFFLFSSLSPCFCFCLFISSHSLSPPRSILYPSLSSSFGKAGPFWSPLVILSQDWVFPAPPGNPCSWGGRLVSRTTSGERPGMLRNNLWCAG